MDKIIDHFASAPLWSSPFQPTACLTVTGEDALTFLQGQFTQELRSQTPSFAAYGLWLNQKGKVLADSFVLREAADYLWIISFSSAVSVIKERLEAYVIADDVVIEDVTDGWAGRVVGGENAEAWVTAQAGFAPGEHEFVKAPGGGLIFRGRRGGAVTFEWLGLAGTVFPETSDVRTAPDLERLRIAAGIPRVPQDIGVGDLPNEGGLDVAGISYTKGCYLGQEVMARLKAMGTVRRRLVRVRAEGRGVPAVPCALLQGEKRVGELRSAADDGAGGFVGLAMVTKLGLDPAGLLAPEPGGESYIQLVDTP
ncbi:MAG: folate-binding protein [Rariglobus sp.]